LTFNPRPWGAFSTEVNRLVDAAAVEADKERKPRDYLGGSRLGEECLRKLAYEFHQTPKDSGRGFDGRLLRIFQRGHDAERRVVEQLLRAGWLVVRGDNDDERTSFSSGKLAGHADGYVASGPPLKWIVYPCLLEIKCVNANWWGRFDREGVARTHPGYFVQMQTYMAYLKQTMCWFLVENADTCELHSEIVNLDLRAAQEASDRAARVIATREPEEMPRAVRSRTAQICRECFFQDRCWSSPATDVVIRSEAQKAGIPDWVKKLHERGHAKQ